MNINELPPEILEEIFSYLTVKENFQCEPVCHLWQRLLFVSIRTLAFEGFEDVFCGAHEHEISKENYLPSKANCDEESMKRIISKCGKHLCSFKGFVSLATMQVIAQICEQLHCIDMLFYEKESLKILADRFCKQLTCATLYTNFKHAITAFLIACTKLTSVAVIPPRRTEPCLSESSHHFLDLFDYEANDPLIPTYFESVQNLVIGRYITTETRNRLPLFTGLKMASIVLDEEFALHLSVQWQDVMISWSQLRTLSVNLTSKCYNHCKHLPHNLEYLSLKIKRDITNEELITFATELPKLKTLVVVLDDTAQLTPLLTSVMFYCPSLEELSLNFSERVSLLGLMDEEVTPLLSMSSLMKLSLGEHFQISDNFASKLITGLKNLWSIAPFGSDMCNKNWMPAGPLFWQALQTKAISNSFRSFNIIGVVDQQLHLQAPIPSNVSLCLTSCGKVKLSNGFGITTQWKELTEHWSQLTNLTIEINGPDLFLNGIPKSIKILTIKCRNEEECGERNTFSFNTLLPNLQEFRIYQKCMSNQELGAIVKCVCKSCPKLRMLCIDRENVDSAPVDEQLVDLLNCNFLEHLCLTEKFKISDIFGSRLTNEVETLRHFGCFVHQLGFHCGPVFLKSLVSKCSVREANVSLRGGPDAQQVKQMVKPFPIPNRLAVVPRYSVN